MHRLLAGTLVVAGICAPAILQAQHYGAGTAMSPDHEVGVDVGIVYASPSGGGTSTFSIFTPVDVRLGFVPKQGSVEPEIRMTFAFQSGGGTFINFDPGLNLLFRMGSATNMHGPYFTIGADATIVSNSPSGGTSTTGVVPKVNAGIGTRMPVGTGATRLEGFVAYGLKSTKLGVPNTFYVGARIGLSLWH